MSEQGDPLRPSFFEVVALEYFSEALEPALAYGLALVAPSWTGHSAELLYGALGLLDAYHMRQYGALWAEVFYGLERSPLSRTTRALSVVLGCGGPYVLAKAQALNTRYASRARAVGGQTPQPQAPVSDGVLHRWLIASLPGFLGVWEALRLLFWLRYLLASTSSSAHSPLLALLGLRLQRASPDQHASAAAAVRSRLWSPVRPALDLARLSLPLAVFLFRFREWWAMPEQQALRRPAATRAAVPPAPPPPFIFSSAPAAAPLSARDPRRCPVCLELRSNPAVGPSGWVACYPCLFAAARDSARDPVSGHPLTVEQITKLFL